MRGLQYQTDEVELSTGIFSVEATGYMARVYKNGKFIGGMSDYDFGGCSPLKLRWELLTWLRRNGYCRE